MMNILNYLSKKFEENCEVRVGRTLGYNGAILYMFEWGKMDSEMSFIDNSLDGFRRDRKLLYESWWH